MPRIFTFVLKNAGFLRLSIGDLFPTCRQTLPCKTTSASFRSTRSWTWIVLRVVNRSSVEYLELRDSLADRGFLNSICVRPSSRKPGKVEVVDGLYRYTARLRAASAGGARAS